MIVAEGNAYGGGTLALVTIALPLLGVIVPILVAQLRGVINKGPTIILSILIGWTVIGAVIPLIVAVGSRTFKDERRQAQLNAAAIAGTRPPA